MNSTAFALDAMRHYNEGFQFPISPRTSFKPVQAPIPFVYCLLCVHNTDLTWHARLKPHIAHRLIQHINHSHFLTHLEREHYSCQHPECGVFTTRKAIVNHIIDLHDIPLCGDGQTDDKTRWQRYATLESLQYYTKKHDKNV